jgi:uncharacterized protein (TIGR02001 family)
MRAVRAALIACMLGTCIPAAHADNDRWQGPFGGEFHADFTVATDFAQYGISNTQNQPAFQVGVNWHSANLLGEGPTLRVYGSGFGSNVSFAETGPGVEIDLGTGLKLGLLDRRLLIDLGYIRYLFPDYPASLGFEYGEVQVRVDYDFGPLAAAFRVRWSPEFVAHSGQAWNKRGLVSVPLSFLHLPLTEDLHLKLYGALGNQWVERPERLDLMGSDFWYWQIGLVTSLPRLGLNLTLAWTDTSLDRAACGFTNACEGRFFASLTKTF